MKICPGPPDWNEMPPLVRHAIWGWIGLFLSALAAAWVHQRVDSWISELVAFLAAAICLVSLLVVVVGLFLGRVLIAVRDVFAGLAFILGRLGRAVRKP